VYKKRLTNQYIIKPENNNTTSFMMDKQVNNKEGPTTWIRPFHCDMMETTKDVVKGTIP